jgi:hypothetical protein
LHRARPDRDPDHKFAKKGFAAVAHHWFGALLKMMQSFRPVWWQALESVELFRRLPAADELLAARQRRG